MSEFILWQTGLFWVLFSADVLRNASRHRNSGNTRRADKRIDFTFGNFAHKFTEENATRRTERESENADYYNEQRHEEGTGAGENHECVQFASMKILAR